MALLKSESQIKHIEKKILSRDNWEPHEIAEMSIVLNGEPLSLDKYKLMYPMYDEPALNTVYKTARQVTKTTTLSVLMTINCFFKRHYKSLYVAPLEQHVYRFSNLNVKPLLKHSPLIATQTDSSAVRSVLVKTFTNGSIMHFGYCQNGVGRIRGISVDEINWDEVQDVLWDNMPIVEQCMSASDYQIQRFCGTPLTLENPLEYLWMQSSQNEPIVKCSRCNKDNIPDIDYVFKMFSKDGPICCHCQELLRIEDILNARWVPADTDREDYFRGYHIPQIFVIRNLTKRSWKRIWINYNKYPKAKLANEVLGLSYDTGGRLLTLTELKKLCVEEPKKSINKAKYINVCAGIDWGISAVTSFTVIVVLGLKSNLKWEVLYFYKFLETDTIYQIDTIAKILRYWQVDLVGCDHGVGHGNNQQLRRRWCKSNLHKLAEYNYVKSKFLIAWNKKASRFSLNRTMSLNNLFFEMKDKKILFPKTERVSEVFDDILAEYEEISEGPYGINKLFRHSPQVPDDYLHAINFGVISSKRLAQILIVDYSYDYDDEMSVA